MSTRTDRFDRLLADLREILDELERGPFTDNSHKHRLPITGHQLLERSSIIVGGDNVRSAALHAAGGRTMTVDDEDKPIVVNDPIGEYAASVVDGEEANDVAREKALKMLRRMGHSLRAAADARNALIAAAPSPGESVEPGCRCHADINVFEEVFRSDRCRWCYDWWRAHKADPAPDLVRAKAEGRKITTKLVREVELTAPQKKGRR